MIAPIFVDTNVLLYARDAGEPSKQPKAAAWLDYLWREQRGRTSVQVLNEYYVNLRTKLKPGLPPEVAWDDVQALLTWNPQPIDSALLERARGIEIRHRLSWWDSLIVAAAQEQGCPVLLSEDFQDGADLGGVTVRSPFTLGVEESISMPYGPALVRRIPRRGRPARAFA